MLMRVSTASNPITSSGRSRLKCTPLWSVGKLQGTQATDADLEHVLLTPDAAIRVSMSAKTFEGSAGPSFPFSYTPILSMSALLRS
jgi:hypothetical protein